MGSQTLEILRQGVWASLTGGWFYDPHQSVFCNVVHLYLWLFLLCSPFVAYLYFPSTWVTWSTYCIIITVTTLVLKLANMGLHRLYDKAQTTSESNIKQHFFKITEERDGNERYVDHEDGIEMKVMRGGDLCNTADQVISGVSAENSAVSIENINSIIADLKVDVHRKNSSESIELMFYAPSMMLENTQNDQQLLTDMANGSKLVRPTRAVKNSLPNDTSGTSSTTIGTTKYGSAYSNDNSPKNNRNQMIISANNSSVQPSVVHLATRPPRLLRKSSEVVRGQLRRRLERQNSLDAAAESAIAVKLIRKSLDEKDNTVLAVQNQCHGSLVHARNLKTDTENLLNNTSVVSRSNSMLLQQQNHQTLLKVTPQRFHATTTSATVKATNASGTDSHSSNNNVINKRLQRHRSSETHDECLKAQQRNKCTAHRLPDASTSSSAHHHHNYKHHHTLTHHRGGSGGDQHMSSSGTLNVDELELDLGSSACSVMTDTKIGTLKSWFLGSSSDVFVEDDSYTKSDLGIEQLDGNTISRNSCGSLQLHKQCQQHKMPGNFRSNHQQLFRLRNPHHCHSGDTTNTKSALQLPVTNPMPLTCRASFNRSGVNRSCSRQKQYSNTITSVQRPVDGTSSNTIVNYQDSSDNTVRHLKSRTVEAPCTRSFVSNFCPQPINSENTGCKDQLKNPENDLHPPASKRLPCTRLSVRHQFSSGSDGGAGCPTSAADGETFGDSSTTSSLDFGSTNALIDSYITHNKDRSHIRTNATSIPNRIVHIDQNTNLQTENCDKEIKCLTKSEDEEEEKEKESHSSDLLEINDQNNVDATGGIASCLFYQNDCTSPQNKHNGESDVGNFLKDAVNKSNEKGEDLENGNNIDNNTEGENGDEFKDFDYDVENILYGLQQTENQLDADLKDQHILSDVRSFSKINIELSNNENTNNVSNDVNHSNEGSGVLCNSERLQSTDSESENNGSRSPLLSNKSWQHDTIQRKEVLTAQHKHCTVNNGKHKEAIEVVSNSRVPTTIPASTSLPSEFDSGGPSNDREQVNSISKDILLARVDCGTGKEDVKSQVSNNNTATNNLNLLSLKNVKNDDQITVNQNETSDEHSDLMGTRNLGAIPKIVQCREVNELQFKSKTAGTISKMVKDRAVDEIDCKRKVDVENEGGECSLNTAQYHREVDDMEFRSKTAAAIVKMHKRYAGNWTAVVPSYGSDKTNLLDTKVVSRNSSSSNSLQSVSAESFGTDMHKMLWLMHGGNVNDRGRHLGNESNNLASVPNMPPLPAISLTSSSNQMSNEQLQVYQDAFKALNDISSAERLIFGRQQFLKQSGRKDSSDINDCSNTLDISSLQNNTVPCAASSRPSANLLDVVAERPTDSPLAVLNNRNISNATTISLQGFFHDIISDEFRAMGSNSVRMGSTTLQASIDVSHNSGNTGILNVDGQNLENYCEYWRPACILNAEKPSTPSKSFYKYHLKCWGFSHEFKICMDRLDLLALFDRDLYWVHIVLAVTLSTLVAYLGACILQHNYYKDIFALFFCAVIAGSQYSLLKSVQPDAASPVHGFNKTVAYSRPIYFCLCGILLLLLKRIHERYDNLRLKGVEPSPFLLFGITFSPSELNNYIMEGLYIFLLSFPVIFSLGLFPQINTFVIYLMEQIDMHIFGGNAVGSLLGSFMCVCRSLCGISILYGPLHAALAESKGTQNILFSIFCALLIPIGYHLSRSPSDFSNTWSIIKQCIMSTYHDDDDELSNTTSINSNQKFPLNTCKQSQNSNQTKFQVTSSEKHGANETIEMTSLEKIDIPDVQEEKENASVKSSAGEIENEDVLYFHKCSKSKNCSEGSNSNNHVLIKLMTAAPSNLCISNHNGDRYSNKNVTTEADKVSSTNSTTQPAEISTYTIGLNEPLPTEEFNCNINCADRSTDDPTESVDPLPKKLQQTVNARLKNDAVVSIFLAALVFSLHCSTVFTVLQPDLNIILYSFTGSFGFLLHYIIPQMRKHMPWLCFARPILKQKEHGRYEVSHAPQIMWFEKFYIYMCTLEKNVLYPLLVISALTADSVVIANKYGIGWGTLIVAICGLKFIRNAYSDLSNQYLIVLFTVLIFSIDFEFASETFLIDYFFVSFVFRKFCDFLLKLQFIVTYIAPWQITWGSAFHAFAQPFSVPHSAMLFLQAAVSAILSTPLNPFLGSAIFLTSYVRPIKFWERDYNTRRIDHSNTRLSSQLERDLGADDNNLNSIFYEHLTHSLQHSLCGDLLMGRWGDVNQGDCFVLASDYLNCLVHVIELGNGLCTFQMRGLEFRGTYCQQREVEAITEDVEDNDGCCCCDPGHLPRMLSVNAMFSSRWLAWQVVASQYVVEGYSISDNLASATLQVFEYRKVLITYYIKSIIYYVMKNAKLDEWLKSISIQDALQYTLSRQFVDLDPIFNFNLDEDFDFRAVGITRSSFCSVYLNWINFCYDKRKEAQTIQQSVTIQVQPESVTAAVPCASVSTVTSTTCKTSNINNSTTASSTPNLSSTQQLRSRSQKCTTTVSSGDGVLINYVDSMAVSHSLANISYQASESVPGFGNTPVARSIKSAPLRCSGNNQCDSNYVSLQRERSAESTRAGSEKPPFIKLKVPSIAKDHSVVSLCLALGLLARRSLATASHNSLTGVEFFLHGLHALFKGDFRITSPRDEWVFADMDLLHAVVAPAVKMALKLQQDHISNPDEFRDPSALYEAIESSAKDLVISHEGDPVWRSAVLRGAPNLLALRHVMEDGSDEYRIIRLTKRFLTFRVIKLNRECVRGLWAGQQQELIYLRNRNPERGSIQNAKQALRNIINSSCDQPIGYPIYVSPLTTSYADTNEQLRQLIGGPITPEAIKDNIMGWWHSICEKCRQGCSSGSVVETAHFGLPATTFNNVGGSGDLRPVYISPPIYNTLTMNSMLARTTAATGIPISPLTNQYCNEALPSMRNNLTGLPLKLNSTTLLASFLSRDQELLKDSRTSNKTGHYSSSTNRSERERRATLPSTSYALPEQSKGSDEYSQDNDTSNDSISIGTGEAVAHTGPCYTKVYSSSGNVGIGHIITTPGEYPRKTKGPICLTATTAGLLSQAGGASNLSQHITEYNATGKTQIDLFERVIIVDEQEIYDGLDERRNFVWPYEAMRLRGGRVNWKGWLPRIGMMGTVVHIWTPNNPNITHRSLINRNLYLLEIADYYVPVTENGVRPYRSLNGNNSKELERSRRNSLQRDILELRQLQQKQHNHLIERVLTPILGSSLESPTSQLAGEIVDNDIETLTSMSKSKTTCDKMKIKAVSSSSSEDESDLLNLELQRRENFINMWKQITENQTTEHVKKYKLELEAKTMKNNNKCQEVKESTEPDEIPNEISNFLSKSLSPSLSSRSVREHESSKQSSSDVLIDIVNNDNNVINSTTKSEAKDVGEV